MSEKFYNFYLEMYKESDIFQCLRIVRYVSSTLLSTVISFLMIQSGHIFACAKLWPDWIWFLHKNSVLL